MLPGLIWVVLLLYQEHRSSMSSRYNSCGYVSPVYTWAGRSKLVSHPLGLFSMWSLMIHQSALCYLCSWVTKFLVGAFQKDKQQYTNAYQSSACITFANVPLNKASHRTKPRFNVGEDHTRSGTFGSWGSLNILPQFLWSLMICSSHMQNKFKLFPVLKHLIPLCHQI